MPKLPRITGAVAKRAFEKAGFAMVRMKGSHAILKKAGHPLVLSIPLHAGKTMGAGLLKSQIDAAGMTVEEFVELL